MRASVSLLVLIQSPQLLKVEETRVAVCELGLKDSVDGE
jgi:hypothetical protein